MKDFGHILLKSLFAELVKLLEKKENFGHFVSKIYSKTFRIFLKSGNLFFEKGNKNLKKNRFWLNKN